MFEKVVREVAEENQVVFKARLPESLLPVHVE